MDENHQIIHPSIVYLEFGWNWPSGSTENRPSSKCEDRRHMEKQTLENKVISNCIFPRFVRIVGKCCIHGSNVL